MKVYLVGGAVRDALMGRPVNERDWVVLNSTPKEMIEKGYLPVGKDFPVFLHPKTKEEYALARTERKVAKGYLGFTYYCAPGVTLEEDLKRRDLTINAIASDAKGAIIDPFNGQKDLKNKVLRHVSPAFAEDPVRLLRVARFAATFSDFQVHPSTQTLMREIVQAGEVDALVPERVWKELASSLEAKAPWRFFDLVAQCGAAPILWAGLTINAFDFTAMKRAVRLSKKGPVRLAALLHRQPPTSLQQWAKRLRLPKHYTDLLTLVARHGDDIRHLLNASPETILNQLERLDAYRRPERFQDCLIAVEASLTEDSATAIRCRHYLYKAYHVTASISAKPFVSQGYSGLALRDQLQQARLEALRLMNK